MVLTRSVVLVYETVFSSFERGLPFHGGTKMRRRLLESVGVVIMFAAVIALMRLTTVPVAGQTPETTAWGHPNLEGIWLDVYATPFERAPELGDREFATAEERAARDQARIGLDVAAGRSFERGPRGTAQDVSGAYNAVFTSVKPAGPRTSLVVDPPNGRVPARTPEAQRKAELQREWQLMLMRNTPTCEQGARGCEGGEYGPPSPRRFDVPPFYNTERMNRHDGPEDQSFSDRCMGGRTPDLNGFRRIVQGEHSIAMGFDTGQGQGFQRIINLSGDHLPSQVRLRHGDSRGRWEGDTLVIDTTNFSPKFPYRGSSENLKLTERYRRVDADTLEFYQDSRKYEDCGQRDTPSALAMRTAIHFQDTIGKKTIEARERQLTTQLKAGLAEIDGVKLWTSMNPELSAGLTLFSIREIPMANIVTALMERDRIYIRTMGTGNLNGVRASTHIYNMPDDVDRLLEGVRHLATHSSDYVSESTA